MLRLKCHVSIGLASTLATGLLIGTVLAYDTGTKWQNASSIDYQIDPELNAKLGVVGAAGQVTNAAARWNDASWFLVLNVGVFDPAGPRTVSAANFQTSPPCQPVDDTQWATTCTVEDISTGTKVRAPIYFNNSPTYRWNTNGVVDGTTTPKQADVYNLALHELGHLVGLRDNPAVEAAPGGAVMFFTQTPRPNLAEDDKQGATQMYGPLTSWEELQARGELNRVALISDVTGYTDGVPPELGPRAAELGVPVEFGTRYELLAGTAQRSYSYVYFHLFTRENDASLADPHPYLTIRPGMRLRWHQYNHQQCTFSVDLALADGTTLRDSGVVDQNGVRVHPAARCAYPVGQWLYFDVDLTPLAGKTIQESMIAYDNGNNGVTGPFRGYFDFLRIEY